MKTIMVVLMIASLALVQSACSVYKASTQPGPVDHRSIGVGSPRQQVIGTLGPPKFSDLDPAGRKQDTFEFQSGLHQASKVRIIPYLAADLITLGLAEIVLWPIELTVMERASCIANVTYDQQQKVESFNMNKRDGVQDC